MLYLLHAQWSVEGETVVVTQLPPTILDFTAIYNIEFTNMQTHSEDLLVDTGWAFSDTKGGEIFYSTISKVFNDFDGKIFLAWYPGEGHVLTAESYENAIFQLGQNDKEFIGDDIQEDTLKQLTDSCFTLSNDYYGAIQNIVSLPSDTKDTISGFEDAAQFLSECFNKGAIKDTSKKIDTSLLDVPELENLSKNMGAITTGIDILQYVYDCYDIATRMSDWDQSNIDQIRVLASFEDLSYINESVSSYINDASKRLIQSYENPSRAVTDEIIQSTISLLSKTIYNESPFGKVASIMGTAGSCIGTFNQKYKQTSDAYSQLSDLGFSVKIENLAYQLMEESKLIKTDEAISDESIKSYRDRLMLYLRLNLRNKAQLYNINIQGNQDKNWKKSAEALHLQSEIVNCYQMITELIATEQSDALLVRDLGKNFKGLYSTDKRGRREAIPVDILMGEDALTLQSELPEQLLSNDWYHAGNEFGSASVLKFKDDQVTYYTVNGDESLVYSGKSSYEVKNNTVIFDGDKENTLNYMTKAEVLKTCENAGIDFEDFTGDSLTSLNDLDYMLFDRDQFEYGSDVIKYYRPTNQIFSIKDQNADINPGVYSRISSDTNSYTGYHIVIEEIDENSITFFLDYIGSNGSPVYTTNTICEAITNKQISFNWKDDWSNAGTGIIMIGPSSLFLEVTQTETAELNRASLSTNGELVEYIYTSTLEDSSDIYGLR